MREAAAWDVGPKAGRRRAQSLQGGPAGAAVGEGLFGAPQSLIPGAGCGSMQSAAWALVCFARQTDPAARGALRVRFGGLVPALWSCSGTRPFGSTFHRSGLRRKTGGWRPLTLARLSPAWRRGKAWGREAAPALETP